MTIISSDMTSGADTTFDYTADNQLVTVKPNVIVENTNGLGSAFLMDTNYATLNNGGYIYGTFNAINNEDGIGCTIRNLQTGYIHSGSSLNLGMSGTLLNYGVIDASAEAVRCYGSTQISNYGTIRGAISLSGFGSVFNSGQIDGTISGGFTGNMIVNHGDISGSVQFYDGSDTYDGRGGTVGSVIGGGGDDTYIVDSTAMAGKIVEDEGGGSDTVESDTVSLNLSDFTYIENAKLLGTGALNLTGDDGNNVLTGNSGRNTLTGGLGDDTYYVQNMIDSVVEGMGGGTDTVHALVSTTLSANVENLVFDGAGNFSGTGNGLANTITGNNGNNVLDGRGGADIMAGGLGDDSYYVDNTQDSVTEAADAGTDTLFTSVSYSVHGQSIETIILQGLNALTVTGTDGNDSFYDNAGNDTLIGGNGNDTYYVTHGGDSLIEAADGGTDTVHSTVSFALGSRAIENLTLDGTGNVNATGNGLANSIAGNSGANVITGSAGNDMLTGGLGADRFVYHAGFGRDIIPDFAEGSAAGHDVIQVDKTLFADYASLMAHTTDTTILGHPAAAINYDAQNGINLLFVTKDSLTAADFKFV